MPQQTLVVETRNSEYRLTIHGSSTRLECVRGTFAGESWNSAPQVDVNGITMGLTEPWRWLTWDGDITRADYIVRHALTGECIAFHVLEDDPLLRVSTTEVQNVRWLHNADPFLPPEHQLIGA